MQAGDLSRYHLGYPTVGIGHLITEDDELYGFEVGSEVSQGHVDDIFHADVQRTLRAEFLYRGFSMTCQKRPN